MGRPPCCDKLGLKKGPWTPEEDIVLVSYIQEHGPGNWRAVPTHTGLMRCSKSCRLRWTNYLRPGIKRGNFNQQEEKMIIHLQALLGNRWAAIASYLPERTDNDIKNYWNTHLRKKLQKLQVGDDEGQIGNFHDDDFSSASSTQSNNKGQWERHLQTDINTAKKALSDALSFDKPIAVASSAAAAPAAAQFLPKPSNSSSSCNNQTGHYALSTDNIARLLENWTTKKPAQQPKSGYGSYSPIPNPSSSEEDQYSRLGSFNSSEEQSDESAKQEERGSLFMLEKWLFDEAAGGGGLEMDQDQDQDQDHLLVDMHMEDTSAHLLY